MAHSLNAWPPPPAAVLSPLRLMVGTPMAAGTLSFRLLDAVDTFVNLSMPPVWADW